jgi:DNA-binding LacI/PurR family transcriptional regulator
MAPTTIHDIARQAGVCIGTVSRVLNNKDRVHPKTRERIQRIIEQTGYRPSAMGRGLVLHRSHSIMLLLHNIADPHCVSLSKHLSRLCRTKGYKMLVGDSDYDPAVEAECLRAVRDGSSDGLLVSPLAGRRNLPVYRKLADSGFPVVAVMDAVPGHRIPCVKYDDLGAGRMATDYLLTKGHRDIAFAGWHTEFQTVRDRYQGHAESHQACQVVLRPELRLQLPKSLTQVRESLAAALGLRASPTAILAENEMVGLACFNALIQLGRRVPDDVAVMVFGDELPEGAAPVPMTAVSLQQSELCQRALALLLEQIHQRGQTTKSPVVESIRPELVVRESA